MEETVSVKDIFRILKKRLILILLLTFISVIITAIVSYFYLTPLYQASTQILVNQTKNEQNTYNTVDLQANLQLINTYNVIIKSPAILNPVIEKLDLEITSAQLNEKILVGSEKNSQVVNIIVRDEDIELAATIANTVANVFKKEITDIMSVDNVSILAPASSTEGNSPIKPKPLTNLSIALVVGLMAGIGMAFTIEYIDNTIKTEQEIEKLLALPVLGTISTIDNDDLDARDTNRKTRSTRLRRDTFGV